MTPHHRVHGVSILLELKELLGEWDGVRGLNERTEHAVGENLATPCIRNARSLLVCAAGLASHGDRDESVELEQRVAGFGFKDWDRNLRAPRIRLALARGDRTSLEELLAIPAARGAPWYRTADIVALLDGMAALGDRAGVEELGGLFQAPGTFFEPFALRALGITRGDTDLISRADERFRVLGLEWHASQTDHLVHGIGRV